MYRRKDNIYQDQLPKPGGGYKYFYGSTKSEVKRKMAEWEAEQEAHWLFENIADEWFARHAENVKHNASEVYRPSLKRAKDYFAERKLDSITPDEVQGFIKHIAGRGYAKRTVEIHLNLINQIFDYAITQPGSTIKYNPCSSVRIPKDLPQTRRLPPTDEQLNKITADGFGLFPYFLMYTGLRRGELLALTWDDIDFGGKIIHVTKGVTYDSNQPIIDTTKTTTSVRDVDLLDVLADKLPRGQKGYVFGGDKPLTKTEYRKKWLAFCRSVGLAKSTEIITLGKNGRQYKSYKWQPTVTAHQFRHAYTSMLDEAGIDETAAMALLGHKSITTTKDIYTHIRKSKRERVATQLNDFVNAKQA
jgi:integrase